ncbi:MAG: MoaD/ThiS family protein [Acidobacteriota bacterium]
MNIQVLFFGATAAIAGFRRIELDMPSGAHARDVYDKLLAKYPRLKAHRLNLSVNQEYATGEEMLNNGDELAVFTAVSGG